MTALAFPETLDTEIDVILDDLPDVAGTLHELRGRKPALWARGFGQPALLLLSHDLVNAAFKDEDVFPSAEFYSHVCPAGVYERSADGTLVVNPPNCVDCKATDVLGPRWTPREGGSGPKYRLM